jgi:hypothetical protein
MNGEGNDEIQRDVERYLELHQERRSHENRYNGHGERIDQTELGQRLDETEAEWDEVRARLFEECPRDHAERVLNYLRENQHRFDGNRGDAVIELVFIIEGRLENGG